MNANLKNQFRFLNRMILSISGNCNLRCKYCYAHFGDFEMNNQPMSLGIGKKGIDLLCEHVKKYGGKKISLVFMGGEPMIQWDLLKKLVQYAKRKTKGLNLRVGFSISTNGTLMDRRKADYLKKNNFVVLVSIDGNNHDKFRPDAKGKGTYRTIVENIKYLKKGFKKQLVLRSTFSKQNQDLFDFYTNFEIKPNRYTELLMIPIISNDSQFKLDSVSLRNYKKELRRYSKHLINEWKNGSIRAIPTNFSALAEMGNISSKPVERPCFGKSIILAPNGFLYSCPILVYNSEYKIGDVENGIDWEGLLRLKQKTDPLNNPKCRKCNLLSRCGGGCYANCLIEVGDANTVNPNYCTILKYELKITQMFVDEIHQIE